MTTLRNTRGGNMPNLIQRRKDCEQFGAENCMKIDKNQLC
ncbi:MAG: hypothetical protein J5701_05615 [Bacteroidales bacterium]|nr:hypothetical protein [Bacteroidales bacterium]